MKRTEPGFQERCARWLLLLTFLHTVPVVWLTPVAGGTVPTVALLAVGVGSLWTLTRDGAAFALFALAPALAYCGFAWGLAWLLGKGLRRTRQPVRGGLLGMLTLVPLLAVHFPIYVAGGHNSSRSADLFELFDGSIDHRLLLAYWMTLHGLLAALYVGHLVREDRPLVVRVARWHRPVLAAAGLALLGAFLYAHYPVLVCRPLVHLGLARAQVCLAQTVGQDERYWYERAARQGHGEAIAWMVAHTHDPEGQLFWLHKGAERGDPTLQFALYERLVLTEGVDAQAEAERWLRLAAEGDHLPAQLTLVDRLSQEAHRTHASDLLAEHNAWLGRAARLGSRVAKLRLAQQHIDGSMGSPADLDRARAYYRDLARGGELTDFERALELDSAAYRRKVDELEAWAKGLDNRDPVVMRAMAERYLHSQLPGPGVRERGIELMEQLAAGGDRTAQDELAVMLRTGDRGVDKNLDAAKSWLIRAAESGDAEAMERVAANYMDGREGFAVDYPEARRWIDALVEIDRSSNAPEAQARVRRWEDQRAYLERLEGHAGSALLGEADLARLGERTDAESRYRFALQLLAGHGSARRAEAIARLEQAARQGHGDAAWRLFQIYERGFPHEIDRTAALEQLELAVANHHFDAARELGMSHEYGKLGLPVDPARAVELYEATLTAGRDNRYGWNLDPENYDHFQWLESRLRQARMKLDTARATGRNGP